MDLLEDPEVKKRYEKCKLIVKVWEHKFTKKNKRLPSKLDIREAPVEVRHAYRKYFQLKTAALEQSFMDVDGFDYEDENISQNLIADTPNETLNEKSYEETDGTTRKPIKTTEEACEVAREIPKQNYEETNVAIPEGTWGSHLNIHTEKKYQQEPKNKPNPNSSFSKKLFCGSKFNKRNPRKSLSFSQKNKSENIADSPQFLSQPNPTLTKFKSEETVALSQGGVENMFKNNSFKIVGATEKISSQPINIIQSFLENNHNQSLRSVDTGWLKRVTQNTGVNIENNDLPLPATSSRLNIPVTNNIDATKVDYDSDIIDNSDEDDLPFSQITSLSLHIAKKRKIETDPSQTITSVTSTHNISSNTDLNPILSDKTDLNPINVPSADINPSDSSSKTAISSVSKQITTLQQKETKVTVEKQDIYQFDEPEPDPKPKKTSRRTRKPKAKPKLETPKRQKEESVAVSPRRSTRKNRVKASFQELSSGEEDPFHSDCDEKDPEFTLEETPNREAIEEELEESVEEVPKKRERKAQGKQADKEKVAKTLRKTRSLRKKEEETKEDEDADESKPYELEFSVKPRIVAPRYSSIKKVLKGKNITKKSSKEDKTSKDPSEPKDKRQQAKEKLEKKIVSGNLNDNFVTINLKKKIFAKGKSGRTFSQYKKSQWKSKKKALYGPDMDMGGCDGGMLTCFNCGQIGHFARNCKATKGDGLLPLAAGAEETEEECPFPTLEEASQMAKGSVLSIRKPKMVLGKEENKKLEEIEGGIGDNGSGEESIGEEEWEGDIDDEMLLAETLKLEEHVKKLDVRAYMDTVKSVKQYYDLKEDNSIIDTPQEVYDTLQMFGHTSFRPGQEQAVMRILSGKSTLVTLSTGSGKSLCYQLPAYLFAKREPCISLIISPLVSLMEDQVQGIPKFLKAACLHTNQSKTQRQKILEAISLGELSVLLVSPEAIVAGERQTGFGSLLRKLPPIAFACIDEAHCVSQWSHNFRPSYLMICRVLRESLGVQTILGLTATATRATSDSIISHLAIPDGREGIISDIPLPDNLILSVSKDAQRDHALLGLLLSERFSECKSIIIYCTRRDECERIAAFLRTSLKNEKVVESTNKKRKRVNLQAEPYHAGLSASRRKTIQNTFMSGELRIVVATVAFGMGINKSDIRSVIHFNMPNSFESYVQEVGRAGRDGLKAHCHLFLDSQGRDENELRRHIHANSIDRHAIRKLLQKIFIPCSCKGVCPKHEVAFSIEATVRALDIPEENISTLLCYLELHQNKYIELLSPAYTICKVISYGGPLQIRKAAKECAPLAMALALHKNQTGDDPNILEFPVVDIASAMGWESGICKHKLKNLEWMTVNNQQKRSALTVQFSNLGFRQFAPGNLSDDQLDEALDSLYERVTDQERKALKQLHAVHETLVEVAKPSYRACVHEEEESPLKQKVRDYFESPDPLANIGEIVPKKICEEQLVNDVRAMVCMYRDNQFTGRAIARIFHGIQSPNYPAVIWGRCKFWRSHLAEDFHEICRIATREIIRMR